MMKKLSTKVLHILAAFSVACLWTPGLTTAQEDRGEREMITFDNENDYEHLTEKMAELADEDPALFREIESMVREGDVEFEYQRPAERPEINNDALADPAGETAVVHPRHFTEMIQVQKMRKSLEGEQAETFYKTAKEGLGKKPFAAAVQEGVQAAAESVISNTPVPDGSEILPNGTIKAGDILIDPAADIIRTLKDKGTLENRLAVEMMRRVRSHGPNDGPRDPLMELAGATQAVGEPIDMSKGRREIARTLAEKGIIPANQVEMFSRMPDFGYRGPYDQPHSGGRVPDTLREMAAQHGLDPALPRAELASTLKDRGLISENFANDLAARAETPYYRGSYYEMDPVAALAGPHRGLDPNKIREAAGNPEKLKELQERYGITSEQITAAVEMETHGPRDGLEILAQTSGIDTAGLNREEIVKALEGAGVNQRYIEQAQFEGPVYAGRTYSGDPAWRESDSLVRLFGTAQGVEHLDPNNPAQRAEGLRILEGRGVIASNEVDHLSSLPAETSGWEGYRGYGGQSGDAYADFAGPYSGLSPETVRKAAAGDEQAQKELQNNYGIGTENLETLAKMPNDGYYDRMQEYPAGDPYAGRGYTDWNAGGETYANTHYSGTNYDASGTAWTETSPGTWTSSTGETAYSGGYETSSYGGSYTDWSAGGHDPYSGGGDPAIANMSPEEYSSYMASDPYAGSGYGVDASGTAWTETSPGTWTNSTGEAAYSGGYDTSYPAGDPAATGTYANTPYETGYVAPTATTGSSGYYYSPEDAQAQADAYQEYIDDLKEACEGHWHEQENICHIHTDE